MLQRGQLIEQLRGIRLSAGGGERRRGDRRIIGPRPVRQRVVQRVIGRDLVGANKLQRERDRTGDAGSRDRRPGGRHRRSDRGQFAARGARIAEHCAHRCVARTVSMPVAAFGRRQMTAGARLAPVLGTRTRLGRADLPGKPAVQSCLRCTTGFRPRRTNPASDPRTMSPAGAVIPGRAVRRDGGSGGRRPPRGRGTESREHRNDADRNQMPPTKSAHVARFLAHTSDAPAGGMRTGAPPSA